MTPQLLKALYQDYFLIHISFFFHLFWGRGEGVLLHNRSRSCGVRKRSSPLLQLQRL